MQDNGQREGNLVNLNFNRTSSISEGCIHDTYVKDCEAGWERQEDHCYLWATAKKNWTAAEDFCQQEGGHLASVASDATMSFVLLGAVKKDFAEVWLGGSDIGEEGVWKWTDCNTWNLTFWAQGEPSNAGGAEHCLQYSKKYFPWNDDECYNEKDVFLCSKKICPTNSNIDIGVLYLYY